MGNLTRQNEILEVIQDLSFARELCRVTEIIRTAARRLTQADGVTFVLKEDGQCFYADEDALAPLWKGKRFPLDACVSGWVMEHGELAVISDIYADARVPHEAYRPTFVKSLAMVPVRTHDPIAAIGAYWATNHEATHEELETLRTLANSAALALTNVQLWSEKEAVAERERAARKQAEELSALKDQFLATVSHELRTPLNVLQGWVWQLRQPNVKPDIALKAVEALDRNVQLQARLVEDLLDTSRAIGGNMKIDSRLVDLGSVCRVVVDAGNAAATGKGVDLVLHVDASAPPLILGDTERLQQIVWNLVSNAIKFTPKGGTITLNVGRSGNRACVTVADTGLGISPEFLPYVFERFRQEDATTTRAYNGLGIGLTIVQQLVRLHGGNIKAESRGPNQGTTMTVEFPVPPVLAEPGGWLQRRTGAVERTTRLDGLSVLLVDDEADARDALRQVLEANGADVLTAASGEEALHVLERRTPSVVLADIGMPVMDGFSFIERVRARHSALKDVPAAALTAFSGAEYRERAKAAGFQGFLEKPIGPEELTRRVFLLAHEQQGQVH